MSGDHPISMSAAGCHQRPLLIAFALTLCFMFVEVAVRGLLSDRFGVVHSTIQVEPSGFDHPARPI